MCVLSPPTRHLVEYEFAPAEVTSSIVLSSDIVLEVFEHLKQEPRDIFTSILGDNINPTNSDNQRPNIWIVLFKRKLVHWYKSIVAIK